MVRFKNRYLIVEFLQPSTSTAQVDITPQSIEFPENDEDEDVDPEDEDEINELPRIPIIPFLLPPIPDLKYLKDGEEGGKGIYKSVRGMVQDVFGDEGWGRISSSFRGNLIFLLKSKKLDILTDDSHIPLAINFNDVNTNR